MVRKGKSGHILRQHEHERCLGGFAGGFRAAYAIGQFHLGDRGRCVARCLCQGEVPRCDPADGGDPAAGRGKDRQSGRGVAAGGGATVLQHLAVHAADADEQRAATSCGFPGDVEGFIEREVLPYAPDAWIDPSKTQIGYEISFTRYFYKPTPMRTLEEI
jgi:hypothetical protein